MISMETIRQFLSSNLSRKSVALAVQGTFAGLISLMALVFVQQAIVPGIAIAYWTLGLASVGVLGFLATYANSDDLLTLGKIDSSFETSRIPVYYLVTLGWATLLGASIHWSFAPWFILASIGSTAILGRTSTGQTEIESERSDNEDCQPDSRMEESASLEPSAMEKGNLETSTLSPAMERLQTSALEFGLATSSEAEKDEDFVEEETLSSDVMRQVVYSRSGDQTFVTAYLRHTLAEGESTGVLQLPLYPHLSFDPAVEILQIEGPAAETRVTQSSKFGVRVELKLDSKCDRPTDILLEMILSQSQETSLAKAG